MSAADIIDISTRLAASLADHSLPAPAPGVYPRIPMDTYHRWSAASNSRLSRLLRSPAHLKAYIDEPPEDTAAQIVGRAVHSAILEPDDFAKRYVFADVDRRTKAGKAEWDGLVAHYGDGYVLKSADYQCAMRVRDAVHAHPAAKAMLRRTTFTELSLVWVDEESGVVCKCRFDGYAPDVGDGILIDVKTTTDARPFPFARTIDTYGYHRQGAFYLDGGAANDLHAAHYVNIAVEKELPYAVAVYRIKDEAIALGRQRVAPLLATYKTCLARNEWPAYPQDVRDIAPPDYAWTRPDDDPPSFGKFGTNYEVTP